MNFDSLQAKLDTFLQHLKRILRTVSGTQSHKTVNASRVLFHCLGDVPVGLSIIRRLSDTDRKSDDPVHPGIVHRLQHVLGHELHNRRDLMNGEFFSRAHMRVRVDDLDSLSFDVNHRYLLLMAFQKKYRIESFLSSRLSTRLPAGEAGIAAATWRGPLAARQASIRALGHSKLDCFPSLAR